MKILKYINRFSKRILGLMLISVLVFVQMRAGASTTVEDSIKSRGYITYDPDSDGSPEMAFYSDDLVRLAQGMDSINDNVAELSDKYEELATTSEDYRTNIINSLNGNVYKNANLAGTTSYTGIISAIQNIPSPTSAIGAYYADGNNDTLDVGITSDNTPISVPIENVYELSLGINEQIILPAGYYENDIIIKNGVKNNGSISFNPSENKSINILKGYYDGDEISSENAYSSGYAIGYADGQADASVDANKTASFTGTSVSQVLTCSADGQPSNGTKNGQYTGGSTILVQKTLTYDLSNYGVSTNDIVLVLGVFGAASSSDYGDATNSVTGGNYSYTRDGDILTITVNLYYSGNAWYVDLSKHGSEPLGNYHTYEGWRRAWSTFTGAIYKIT